MRCQAKDRMISRKNSAVNSQSKSHSGICAGIYYEKGNVVEFTLGKVPERRPQNGREKDRQEEQTSNGRRSRRNRSMFDEADEFQRYWKTDRERPNDNLLRDQTSPSRTPEQLCQHRGTVYQFAESSICLQWLPEEVICCVSLCTLLLSSRCCTE